MIDHVCAERMPVLTREFFARRVEEVAPDLIGYYLFTTIEDTRSRRSTAG